VVVVHLILMDEHFFSNPSCQRHTGSNQNRATIIQSGKIRCRFAVVMTKCFWDFLDALHIKTRVTLIITSLFLTCLFQAT